jgi:hypothetical protein
MAKLRKAGGGRIVQRALVALALVAGGIVFTATPASAACQANDAAATIIIRAGYPFGYTPVSYYCSGTYSLGGIGGVNLKTRGWSGIVTGTFNGYNDNLQFCDWENISLWGWDINYFYLSPTRAPWC